MSMVKKEKSRVLRNNKTGLSPCAVYQVTELTVSQYTRVRIFSGESMLRQEKQTHMCTNLSNAHVLLLKDV